MTTNNAVNNSLSGATGTGSFVGSTSPTITTPVIAQINDVNGNAIAQFTETGASDVNYLRLTASATGFGPTISANGSDSNVGMVVQMQGTGGFNVVSSTSANGLQVLTGTTGVSPVIAAIGSDTNISLNIQGQGTGTINLAPQFANYIAVSGASSGNGPAIYAVGGDTNVALVLASKGTGAIAIQNGAFTTAQISTVASAVNRFQMTSSATGVAPYFGVDGTDSNIIMQLSGKGTGGVTIAGTTAADNAAAGYVGELLSSANATAVAMTTATVTQIQTLSLTAGDWDVWGTFYTTVNAATTQSLIEAQLHTNTATIAAPTTAQLSSINGTYGTVTTGKPTYLNTGVSRWNVNGATTVYLNASATYATNTLTGNGAIYARRVR